MLTKLVLSSLIVGASLLGSFPLRADSVLRPNDIVAICGDSITQQKRYSVMIEDYLMMCQSVPNVHAVQFGKNGAGAYVLNQNINDLAPFHPTVGTMLFGMNDGQYRPLNDDRANAFRKGMTDSVEGLKRIGVRDILVASPDTLYGATMYNVTLGQLGDIARDVAQKEGVLFIDNHAIMDAAIKLASDANPTADNHHLFDVHPEPVGHMLMAYSFLKGLGCDGAIGTITVNLPRNRATGTPGQKIMSVRNGVVVVESTRYPFCFHGNPTTFGPDDASILKYLPFNHDLNRYMLVVHGIKTAKAKVTWGDSSVVIDAADLDKGVNLADLFIPSNPFSAQFDKVDAAVTAKQTAETTLTWEYLANVWRLKQAIPSQVPLINDISVGGYEEVDRLTKLAEATVVPVRHTIAIEPVP